MIRYTQKTVAGIVSIAGVGLHSGKRAKVTLRPAEENTGYLFINKDINNPSEIPALFDKVIDTTLATTIGVDGVSVKTVEHLVSALRGLDIDNVIIEAEGGEVPIMDGSCAPFVYILKKIGFREQRRYKKFIMVSKVIEFRDGDKFVRIEPSKNFEIDFTIDFPHPAIGKQHIFFRFSPLSFERDIARARTFGFFRDVQYLKSKGLALGGSLENAIVLGEEGILNQEGLRYKDEFVRHKVLDLLGDIALLGYPVVGRIIAYKSGHHLNNMLCKELFENRKDFRVVEYLEETYLPMLSDNFVMTERQVL
ncbi:MAG: UDP-3-O-acyl-N-acetylglucosamine deacetylase [Proteobacteria bacterium]|nr:UDP-3-O-acyl-N-acetylglucosamine deacetylase [Pseudomonadota bacterium]